MIETEWAACAVADKDTGAMQDYLQDKGGVRRLRLFACACCRRIEALLIDPRSRRAVGVAERYADGAASDEELSVAWLGASDAVEEIDEALGEAEEDSIEYYAALAAHYGAMCGGNSDGFVGFAAHAAFYALRAAAAPDEAQAQGRLLGDVLGRPPSLLADPSWLTPGVLGVARVIDAERRFDDMPILADALEDAGCTDANVMAHCRGDRPHVRGCWVVDLLLGRS
jgi:hypothetical protein